MANEHVVRSFCDDSLRSVENRARKIAMSFGPSSNGKPHFAQIDTGHLLLAMMDQPVGDEVIPAGSIAQDVFRGHMLYFDRVRAACLKDNNSEDKVSMVMRNGEVLPTSDERYSAEASAVIRRASAYAHNDGLYGREALDVDLLAAMVDAIDCKALHILGELKIDARALLHDFENERRHVISALHTESLTAMGIDPSTAILEPTITPLTL